MIFFELHSSLSTTDSYELGFFAVSMDIYQFHHELSEDPSCANLLFQSRKKQCI